jgi:hypothetical protein
VGKTEKIIEQMRRSPQNVRFADLAKVCADHFGEPRQDGTSHNVYKTPWPGDPRMNIQRGKDGMPRRTKCGAAGARCNRQAGSREERGG